MEIFIVERHFIETCHDWFSHEDYDKVTHTDISDIFDTKEKAEAYIEKMKEDSNNNPYNKSVRIEYSFNAWRVK